MFVKILNRRIKIASISEYEAKGPSLSNPGYYYILIKVSGKERQLSFSNKEQYDTVIKYLDEALKVKVL